MPYPLNKQHQQESLYCLTITESRSTTCQSRSSCQGEAWAPGAGRGQNGVRTRFNQAWGRAVKEQVKSGSRWNKQCWSTPYPIPLLGPKSPTQTCTSDFVDTDPGSPITETMDPHGINEQMSWCTSSFFNLDATWDIQCWSRLSC